MSYFVLESGAPFILENGVNLLLEDGCDQPIFGSVLLLESGAFFLLEDGTNLLLEPCGPIPPVPPSRNRKGRENPQRRFVVNEAMEEEDLQLILGMWINLR